MDPGFYLRSLSAGEQRLNALAWELARVEHKLDHVLGVAQMLVEDRARNTVPTTQVSYFLIFIPDDV